MKQTAFSRHLSMLGAWALAFGCAVGADAFVMPWNDFLPKAGPLGTVLGIFIGGLIMAVVAWNFHYMINRQPGPGGTYAYASEAFGHDHGFLCGVFLAFAYLAIVWLDVTALVVVAHYMLGDAFRFGFRYTIQESNIYLGDILLSVAAIVVASAICCRRRLSGVVQSALAVILAAGILICFGSAAINHHGGLEAMRPFFAPDRGSGLLQTLNILAIAPWLFVGFEAISNSSSEFRFPAGKSFRVMLAALVTAVIAYTCLTFIPVLTLGEGVSGWTGAVADLVHSGNEPDYHAFDAASQFFGKAGIVIIGVTLVGAIFTNLVGNTVAASRLAAAMADDGALPSFLGGRNADGAPRNAVLVLAALAVLVVPLGRAVIGVVVDISILGAAVAYAYTSAAAFKTARKAGDRGTQATGLLGLVVSIVVIFLFVMPFMTLDATMIATESYLVLIIWCLAALATFITIFHRDSMRRFGRSPVAWISLFVIIMILSVMWIRQTTRETTGKAYEAIVSRHAETCDAASNRAGHGQDVGDWHLILRKNLSNMNKSIFRSNLVQTGLNLLALALMFGLYAILRRREREMEREKATAKSYFFSTVSHDIRTPLNAIIGYSTMLESGFKTEAERKEAIDSILMSGKTLLGLVNDVLDLSKLESGKMEILPEPTDCSRLMRTVMEAFRVSSGGLGFELRCRAEEMPLLMLDPQRLRQIVFNLLGNAVKFTEKGYVELRARFERRKDADSGVLRLEVEDTGCGISEEDLKRIGSAYTQVGAKASHNGGTGLGLAICKQLAAAMGGSLEVDSTPGAGSTFSVVIPNVKIAPVHADAMNCVPPVQGHAAGSAAHMPHRILLVDDSRMNLMVLKALLKNMGDFEIAMASDGQEALKVLEAPDAKAFDLVLTDMWMPNLDGAGLIRAIRANPALASLCVVAVTADVESQMTYADMGFNGILLKPVTTAMLGKALSGGL
ncbi:MAG: amino acid permease [Kiritimatiellae bacterium]|nr:amino acid permease [Kiritimatiellia bacterium]